MKTIIAGCGKVGSTLAEQLNREGHDITLIDINSTALERVSAACDVIGLVGNGISYSVQSEAGIEDADLFIAVTDSDEINLLSCLIAKKAGNCKTIARVRNPIYDTETTFLRNELGISMIINPEMAAAQEIGRLVLFPSAIEIDTFARGRVELLKIQVPKGSVLHNLHVFDIVEKLKCDVLICAVERDDDVIIPGGNFVLKELDTISFVASPKQTYNFFKKIGIKTSSIKHCMIVGGGKIAYHLTRHLLSLGIHVKIVERNKERCEELSALLPDAVIIQGDGTNETLLNEEGIEYAESFVSLTDVDEENILLSLYVASCSNAKVMTKINRISFKEIIGHLNLGSIICPKNITAEHILQYVRAMQNSMGSNVETLYRIVSDKVEALAFNIKKDSPIIGITFDKMDLKSNLLICSIIRKGKTITPRGQDMIKVGDQVIVVTTNSGLKDICDILR